MLTDADKHILDKEEEEEEEEEEGGEGGGGGRGGGGRGGGHMYSVFIRITKTLHFVLQK